MKTGCLKVGCLCAIAFAGLIIYKAARSTPPKQSTTTDKRDNAEPEDYIVEMQFRHVLRKHLNDPESYRPGEIKKLPHPDGYAYVHAFRAKNAFGAFVINYAGLVYSTNAASIAWTYYDNSQIAQLYKETMPLLLKNAPPSSAGQASSGARGTKGEPRK